MPAAYETTLYTNLARFAPEEARKRHIAIARAGLAEYLASQQNPPGVQIVCDGSPAASEDAVKSYGVIRYNLVRMRQATRFGLEQAIDLSPVRSGRYKRAWFILVNNAETAIDAVPEAADEIYITNDLPYSRKIETRGARIVGVPPGIVERVRQRVQRAYGAIVVADIVYLNLTGAYVLRRSGKRRSQKRGRAISYPALRLRRKV